MNTRWGKVATGVLALLAVILTVQWWNKHPTGNDFATYVAAARALWSGSNPYVTDTAAPFVYPLFLCVVLWPFSLIPAFAAGFIWLVMSIGSAIATVVAVARIEGRAAADSSRLLVAAAVVFVLLADVVQNNLLNGQVNFVVIGCCAAFAWSRHRGRPGIGSIWLAIAIAIKLTPAIFLGFLARRLEWRRIAETAALTVVLAVVLPWAIAGSNVFDYYRDFFGVFAADRFSGIAIDGAERIPFSIAGALRRFAGVTSPLSAPVIGLATGTALLVVDRGSTDRGRPLALTFCLYLAAALLITPMSEVHHLAAVLPGLTLLTWDMLRQSSANLSRATLAAVLIAGVGIRDVAGAAIFVVAGTCALLVVALRRTP